MTENVIKITLVEKHLKVKKNYHLGFLKITELFLKNHFDLQIMNMINNKK